MAASRSQQTENRVRFIEGSPEHHAYLLGQQDVLTAVSRQLPSDAKEITLPRILSILAEATNQAQARLLP